MNSFVKLRKPSVFLFSFWWPFGFGGVRDFGPLRAVRRTQNTDSPHRKTTCLCVFVTAQYKPSRRNPRRPIRILFYYSVSWNFGRTLLFFFSTGRNVRVIFARVKSKRKSKRGNKMRREKKNCCFQKRSKLRYFSLNSSCLMS